MSESVNVYEAKTRSRVPGGASVRLLLDTNALLWWLAGEGLAVQARDAIADPENLVVVSAVSAWEISIKQALGKLAAPDDLEHQVPAGGFVPLPMTNTTSASCQPDPEWGTR
jgi:PIN domain nuclease of toxin-antitoxin system